MAAADRRAGAARTLTAPPSPDAAPAPPAPDAAPAPPAPALVGDTASPGQADVAAFLARVGANVRTERARRGLSRKLVAELSGVSQRYLAQLESGSGNISIMLLRQVARAIGVPMAWLLAEDEAEAAELRPLVTLLARATPQQRAQVRSLLGGAAGDGAPPPSRYALIGLRGAGKSTLGRLLAARLDMPFLQLNREIERESGMAVDEIFALYGQEGYRRLEFQALTQVAERHERVVLEAAGGIVSEHATFDRLLARFVAIWVRATPEEHMGRVLAQGDRRPMAGNPAAMEELKAILTSREALYARAPIMVDTSRRTVEQSLEAMLAAVAGYRGAAARLTA